MNRLRGLRDRVSESEATVGLLMLSPILLALVVLRLWPAILALRDSFVGGKGHGLNLSAYSDLLRDPTFLNTLYRTAIFSIIVNPLQIAIALGLALLVNRPMRLGGLYRTLIVLPVVIPQSISALIWGVALRPDGPVNAALVALGLPAQGFFTSTFQALPSIILVVSWVGCGYWMTFLLAGLNDIPETIYEAAVLDGANRWKSFVHITLPLLRRPLLFVLVANTVANFLVFAPVQILTNGGPQETTNLIMLDIYTRTFVYGDARGGAAATVILACAVLIVVLIQFSMMRERDSDENRA